MYLSPHPGPRPSITTPPAPPGERLVHRLALAWQWTHARPWLAVFALTALAAWFAGRALLATHRQRHLSRDATWVTITPPAEVEPAGAAAWWANVHDLLHLGPLARLRRTAAHVAFEYRWSGRALTIGVWVPGTVAAASVAAAVRAAWPGASTTVAPADAPLTVSAEARGGALIPTKPAWYPLATAHTADPTRALVAAASGLRDGDRACVQVLARPATARQVTRLRRGATALRTGQSHRSLADPATWLRGILDALTPAPPRTAASHRSPTEPLRERDARLAADKAAGVQWQVALRYAVVAAPGRSPGDDRSKTGARLGVLAQAITAAFGVYRAGNALRPVRMPAPAATLAARVMRGGFLLSATELAALAGLPLDLAVAGLDRARSRSVPAPVAVPAGGRGLKVLGRAEIGGHSVAMSAVDARQHVHLLGSTGSGKSTLMTHMILGDIAARRGVVVIDPMGDLIAGILDRLPATDDITRRLVVIDPDQPGGATFNPLEGDDPDLVVDNVVSIFSTIFAKHWGPRMDDVLRVSCLTLLRKANATLALVQPLLNDRRFRASFTADLDDPAGLRGFWDWFESAPIAIRAQIVGAVESRLRQFLTRPFIRDTLSAPRSSFDMGRVLDGGILLARVSKGQLGDKTAQVLGSLVFARVWQAATARAGIPEARRRDAAVYVDEAHNVLNLSGSVTDMLAEARGYRLSLVLAHQHLGQLTRETQLALSANARNKIYFACSPEDANDLARHTAPELRAEDLVHLGDYTAAARLIVANRSLPAFTLRTAPPVPKVGETTAIRRAIARVTGDAASGIEELARHSGRE